MSGVINYFSGRGPNVVKTTQKKNFEEWFSLQYYCSQKKLPIIWLMSLFLNDLVDEGFYYRIVHVNL